MLGSKVSGFGSPYPPVEGHGTALPPELAPSAAAAVVYLRVDRDTGRVELLDWLAVQDVGRALNPPLVEGAQQVPVGAGMEAAEERQDLVAHEASLRSRVGRVPPDW